MMSDIHASHTHGLSRVTQIMSMTCEASHFSFVPSILTVLHGNVNAENWYKRLRPDHRHDKRRSCVSQARSQQGDTDNEYNVLDCHH